MQDWIGDGHDTFHQALKTAMQLHAGEFMTCSTCDQRPWIGFFFDGTGNNKCQDADLEKLSNVACLYEGHSVEKLLVTRFYCTGVGTPLDISNPVWWMSLLDFSDYRRNSFCVRAWNATHCRRYLS